MPIIDFFQHMFSPQMFQWELLLALVIGAVAVTPFGTFTTKAVKRENLHYILGVLMGVLGIWTLAKAWL